MLAWSAQAVAGGEARFEYGSSFVMDSRDQFPDTMFAKGGHTMARTLNQVVFIGIKGTALALDRATGRELWRTDLKGSDFVNTVLDGGDLFATTHGEIFCLDPATGRIRWNNPLKGLGWGLVTIAPSEASSVAAMAAYRRQQEAAAAAAGSAS
jgi:outer membrane protein assembly factor BamB